MVKATVVTAALVGLAAVAVLGITGPGADAPASPPRRVFAFLSRADGRELTRLAQIGRRISVLAPNWYELDVARGSMREPWDRTPVLAAARRAGVPVWPVVNARTGGSAAIDDPLSRARAVRAVVRVASDPAYAGVTLDVEELLATQRDSYSAFVREVASALSVRRRKLAVYAPRPTRGGSALAYDWPALAAAADLLLVATYNETGPQGPPGPLDSSAGYADVLARAAAVSRERTAPIVGAIGYAWGRRGPGRLLSIVDAEQRRANCRARRTVADGNASYRCGGDAIHYATVEGLRSRASAAGAAGFRWFALFSLGREPRSFWNGMPRVRR
jgi:hypothetical protein